MHGAMDTSGRAVAMRPYQNWKESIKLKMLCVSENSAEGGPNKGTSVTHHVYPKIVVTVNIITSVSLSSRHSTISAKTSGLPL
jgi:hypothetical protein